MIKSLGKYLIIFNIILIILIIVYLFVYCKYVLSKNKLINPNPSRNRNRNIIKTPYDSDDNSDYNSDDTDTDPDPEVSNLTPKVKVNRLLQKCFDKKDIKNFKKYYNQAHVIHIDDGLVFSTPCQVIKEIPHLTWNGVFLNNLCVDPKMRNKGLGTLLVTKVIEKAQQDGKDHVMLQVADDNHSAINIYKKLGFLKYMQGNSENGEEYSIYLYTI